MHGEKLKIAEKLFFCTFFGMPDSVQSGVPKSQPLLIICITAPQCSHLRRRFKYRYCYLFCSDKENEET